MSAPSSLRREARRVTVLGRDYRELPYVPQFGLGIICRDQREQQRMHRRLARLFPTHDVKVLVI